MLCLLGDVHSWLKSLQQNFTENVKTLLSPVNLWRGAENATRRAPEEPKSHWGLGQKLTSVRPEFHPLISVRLHMSSSHHITFVSGHLGVSGI